MMWIDRGAIVDAVSLSIVTDPDEVRRLEREILVRALGDLGAGSGAIGGQLGGGFFGGHGGRRGGRRGAEFTAKRLREDRCELSIESNARPEAVLETASKVLAGAGRLVSDLPSGLEQLEVWGVVGSGMGRLNPAVVRVTAVPVDEDRSRAIVRAVALEYLIKRRGGQKAAVLVRDALEEAMGP